jgi:hypothetical protein
VRKRGPCSCLLPDLLLPGLAGQVGEEILLGCGEPDDPGGWVARWRLAGSGTGRSGAGTRDSPLTRTPAVDARPIWLADLVRVAVALGSAGARQSCQVGEQGLERSVCRTSLTINLFLSAKLSRCGGHGVIG